MTFGAFISTRRKEAKLNLRDTAKHLGISNGYLCDIEQGRRPAPEGAFVERISSFLELDKQEHEMLLDLAADSRQTVPADLPDYIRQHDIVRAALRVAKEVDAMVIIGDKQSSNTKKLYEIAKKHCSNSFFAENISDLPLKEIQKYK